LRPRRRPRLEHRGSLHRPPAPQARCRGHRDGARPRVPDQDMMVRSLRGRVLLASILWTVGLIFIVSMLFSLAMEHVPRARIMVNVHGFLQAYIVVAGATLCLIAAVVQGQRTLASIDSLRTRLVSLRAGRESRMEGVYPSEVQPLVD